MAEYTYELCQNRPLSAVSPRTTPGAHRPKVAELGANSATCFTFAKL